jgi:hypothetical protein
MAIISIAARVIAARGDFLLNSRIFTETNFPGPAELF